MLAASIVNSGFAQPEEPVLPSDPMFGLPLLASSAPRRPRINRKRIVADARLAFAKAEARWVERERRLATGT